MTNTKTISKKIVDLAMNYRELSRKYFGWKSMYMGAKNCIVGDVLSDETEKYWFYFAEDSDFTAVHLDEVEVHFHPQPTINMPAYLFDNLEGLYKKHLKIYRKAVINMKNHKRHITQDEKRQRIEFLKSKIDELSKN